MKRMLLLLLVLAAGSCVPAIAADVFGVAWDPVSDPRLTGYEVELTQLADGATQIFPVEVGLTTYVVTGLSGRCDRFQMRVRSVAGALSSEWSPAVEGICEPEVFEVVGNAIAGDNFDVDVQVFLDGSETPAVVERVGCRDLVLVDSPEFVSLVVRNVADGTSTAFTRALPVPDTRRFDTP